jgi:iron complex outermembrane receptor protein
MLHATLSSQTTTLVYGTITDEQNLALPGASVQIVGRNEGVLANEKGMYEIEASVGAKLSFSFVGYKVKEVLVKDSNVPLNVQLLPDGLLEEVVLIGSKNTNRTSLETTAPIDVLDIATLSQQSPQLNVNQLLNQIAPSFSSTPQLISDGTDNIDPASLRGLGPDQVLVLINGKRRHTSALVNVNGTPGRGSVGTDMNAIPIAAIERIEVLRDGAAAQFGSDAIAGVINIVLRKDTEQLEVSAQTGGLIGSNNNNFTGGMDGEDFQLSLNRGLSLGKEGGFINFTASINARNRSSRTRAFTGEIFNGYNAIEWEASKAGADLNALFTDLDAIKTYAGSVSHFSPALKSSISSASDLQTVRDLLSDTDGNPIDFSDAELEARGLERTDFSMNIGQSQYQEGKLFMNFSLPIKSSRLYAFGGISNRKGVGFAFYRRPTQARAYTPLNINGLRPEANGDVSDQSIAIGWESKVGEWETDLSNTWGSNTYAFAADKSGNASLQGASPEFFRSWTQRFSQNTTNFDMSRYWADTYQGLHLSFGSEYRIENYRMDAGQESSWAIYDVNGQVIDDFNLVADSLKVVDFFGRVRPGGAQAFPGIRPESEADATRQNVAAYTEVEVDWTKSILTNAAVRYEHYSDFGSTLNAKLAARVRLSQNFNIRVSANTGFRAPSLHQINFSSVSTQFINGIGFQVLTASNTSVLAKSLGIDPLKQETSQNLSAGITYKLRDWGLSFTLDGFYTRINDRVILTDQFSQDAFETAGREDLVRDLITAGAEKVQFFTNGINTQTTGVELVLAQTNFFGSSSKLTNSLAASFIRTQRIGAVLSSERLSGFEDTYFSERSRIYLEEAMPQSKANLSHLYVKGKWNVMLRNTYFGAVRDADSYVLDGESINPLYSGAVITDLSVGYRFSKSLHATIGCNNLFDIYPEERVDALTSGNQFIYSRRVAQFGINGRYVFTRLTLTL